MEKAQSREIFERLDYIFTTNLLTSKIGASGISPTFQSDHAIPWIVLTLAKCNKGRGFWRLNTSLLADPDFDKMMQETIKDTLNTDMTNVNKWEWLKHKVREKAIGFTSARNKSRNNKLLLYEKKLIEYNQQLLETCTEENNDGKTKVKQASDIDILTKQEILKQIDWLERERDSIIEYKVRGSMLRGRKDWTIYGEKPTRYYLGLEGSNYKRKNRFLI